MKTCRGCLLNKSLDLFYKKDKMADGHSNHCKNCTKNKTNKWREKNIDKRKDINNKYYKNNKENIINKRTIYRKNRYNSDINFKLSSCLRSRLTSAIKNNHKSGSAIKDLGCSIEEFRLYLESQFEPWMNWDNHGNYDLNRDTWQIDHKEAISKFDLTNKEELKKACHYVNLRPLKAIDNLRKGANNDSI